VPSRCQQKSKIGAGTGWAPAAQGLNSVYNVKLWTKHIACFFGFCSRYSFIAALSPNSGLLKPVLSRCQQSFACFYFSFAGASTGQFFTSEIIGLVLPVPAPAKSSPVPVAGAPCMYVIGL
jgi:hypothetical protein